MAKGRARNEPHHDDAPHTRVRIDPIYLAAGAAVIGAIVAAFAPRSDAETRLLAPLGAQVNLLAGSMGASARQVFSAEVAAIPLVGQMAVQQLDHVLGGPVDAA